MTTQIPKFTQADIQRRIDSRSFSRGQNYARQGAIVMPKVQGSRLQAQCYGSSPTPYRLWVDFDSSGIDSALCSCPVGGAGACKHVAALLLTWLKDASQFTESVSLKESLAQRDKTQLIGLIERMIDRYPDLEDIVSLTPTDTSQINAKLIRRQVEAALQQGDYDHDYYGAAAAITQELLQVSKQGEQFADAGNWQSAALVYQTVLDETLASYDEIYDHDGELSYALDDCAQGLARCLENVKETAAREPMLHALFDFYAKDVMLGGYGMADEIPDLIYTLTTEDERKTVAQWTRELLSSTERDWAQQTLGGFLLSLTADEMSDDEYIRTAQETGRLGDAIDRLLELERVDDAIEIAKTAGDYQLLRLAELFSGFGHADRIETVIWERTATSKDSRLDEWLQRRAEQSGNWSTALTYCKTRFRERPYLSLYKELAVLAKRVGIWENERAAILAEFEQKDNFGFLVDIFLSEGLIGQAVDALQRLNTTPTRWGYSQFDAGRTAAVAKAAEESHPQESIKLYQTLTEKLIAQRGRDNYAQAAQHLQRVKAIYTTLGQTEKWTALITNLRTENKALRAMKDEFNKAKL